MKITMVAPVPPFRGGIARHSHALARALAERTGVDITLETFARLYPRRLYPGTDDRDPDGAKVSGMTVRTDLDCINPFSWRRVADRIVGERPDLVVMPAWTFFVAPALASIARRLRREDIPVLAMVHNVGDHEESGWKRMLIDRQLRAADMFMTHNDELADMLRERLGDVPVAVNPHPMFDDFPAARGTLERRAPLELLFFGLVRPYKGLDVALDALARPGLEHVRLTVAGEFWQRLEETRDRIGWLGLEERVDLIPRYVPDAEAAELFARADAVLLPYRKASASGVIPLARHYRKPVVASRIAGLMDQVEFGEDGWLFEVGDSAALADLLGQIDRESVERMEVGLERAAERLGWDVFAARLIALAEEQVVGIVEEERTLAR